MLLAELNDIESILQMENILLTPHRSKLGATDFVGNVANALFGVLDSGYAKMYNCVEMIKGNEQH